MLRSLPLLGLPACLLGCARPTPAPAAAAPPSPAAAAPARLEPVRATEPVTDDADDPAFWLHPGNPARSLLLGTNKAAAPTGALQVWTLEGRTVQVLDGLDRPNNVDLEYGLPLAGGRADIAVVAERNRTRLRIFTIRPDGSGLDEVTAEGATQVFAGCSGDQAACMGVALYKRSVDGAIFAIVSRKAGPSGSYLWQYRLADDGAGRVAATKVREFGLLGTEGNEVEAIAVDDELGYVYYAEESYGIHKYHADPDHPAAAEQLACFGTEGFEGDREGLAVIALAGGTGYLVASDQQKGGSELHLYRREGMAANPHDHTWSAVVATNADDTDGVEAFAGELTPDLPGGLVVMMNSGQRNFLLYAWDDIARAAGLR